MRDVRSSTLRTNGNVGVFSAYFDVTWNGDLAAAVSEPEFSSEFATATSGTVSDGLLDEVGATSSSLSATTDDAQVLFNQRFEAIAAGPLQFTLDPADVFPGHEVLNFGSTAPIDASEVQFDDESTLNITDTPTAPDLVAFAKALDEAGAIMYGAAWCPHCTAQKELFQDGQEFVPFVEVTNPDRTPNQIAIDNNIDTFPTWVFADGSRLSGLQTLEDLANAANVEIPQSNRPFLIPIDDVDMFATSTFHVPLDAYDPNGGPLTFSVTSDNPDVTPTVLSGNRSITYDVAGYGKMTFELFDEEAPLATNRMVTLAETGVHDGVILHRVFDDFVIQGGDPDGTGFGSSDLPDFDDQFDFDLQHNRVGVLSMAKSNDDTNNSAILRDRSSVTSLGLQSHRFRSID